MLQYSMHLSWKHNMLLFNNWWEKNIKYIKSIHVYLNYACNAIKLLLNGHGITIKQSNRRPGRQMHHELLIYSSYRE